MESKHRHRPPHVCLYLRGLTWWVSYYPHGIKGPKIQRSTGLTKKQRAAAVDVQNNIQAQLTAEWFGHPPETIDITPEPMTLHELGELFIEKRLKTKRVSAEHARRQADRIRRIVRTLGEGTPAMAVDVGVIEDHVAARLDVGVSPTTVCNDLKALKAVYRWAVRREGMPRIPWEGAELPTPQTHRDAYAPLEDVKAILGGLDLTRDDHRAIYLAIQTGMRRSDIETLKWADLDFERGVLRKKLQKTAKRRKPITLGFPLVEEVVDALRPIRGIGPVVHGVGDTKAIQKITKGLCGTAHGTRIFRHTLAHYLEEAGADLHVRGRLLGHTMTNVTSGYTHTEVEHLRQFVARLPWLRRYTTGTTSAET